MSELPVAGGSDDAGLGVEPKHARSDRLALALLVPLALILAVVIAVFYVLFAPLQVDGPSMQPTLLDQDRLLMTRGYPTPARGDIIALTVKFEGVDDDIIKRVIALPGDTVEVRADVAYVNGVAEPDRGQVIYPRAAISVAPQVVPEATVWVMGDNRAVSADSRNIGPVRLSDAAGKAVAVFSPVTRIRRID